MTASGLFITGTDTGVGKTHIGTQLCKLLISRNIPTQPRKPVESGCETDSQGQLLPQDAIGYFSACGQSIPLEEICPYAFTEAVAPDYAAKLAGINLQLEQLVAACHVSKNEFLLVEGAGGFYSPIATNALNADLAVALDLPVLLIAANRLGAINHTLLTAEAIQQKGLRLAAVILNDTVAQDGAENLNNLAALELRLDCPVLMHPENSVLKDELLTYLNLP